MFRIDPNADRPVSAQLRDQVVQRIGDGSLPAGAGLPSVRRLAEDLGVAPNTVAKVYRGLEHEGYLTTDGRRGTAVADSGAAVSPAARRCVLTFVAEMRALGLGPGETVRMVRQALDD